MESEVEDEIRQWLKACGLEKHGDAFVENGIGLDIVAELDPEELVSLGLNLGDRKRLARAIRETWPDRIPLTPEHPAPDPERRQLTVMFCDLVGSTALSQRLDPEDLRDVMRRYRDAVSGALIRYGGFVSTYLGDGIMVYFGWPRAYEDAAERAVQAGLEAVSVVGNVRADVATSLTVRVGIATGEVVVGDLVGERGQDVDVVTGETPNLAARLQGLARPGEVVVCKTTRDLCANAFRADALGNQELKGFDIPVGAWSIVGRVNTESRFDASHPTAPGLMVGRERELEFLVDRLRLAEAGRGQVVLVSGEPGIGKSRLLQDLRDQYAADYARVSYQCSSYHTHSALYSTIEYLRREAGLSLEDSEDDKLDKLEQLLRRGGEALVDDVPLFAALLSLSYEDRYGAVVDSPQENRERLLQGIVSYVVGRSRHHPLLFVVEDAHWIDPTSELLLERLVPHLRESRVLLVVTHRPEWRAPFRDQPQIDSIELGRLRESDCAQLIGAIAGDRLSAERIHQVVERTDGIPLYLEEVARAIGTHDNAAGADIPTSLQASLLAHLDRLSPEAKRIAQIGSVFGREFRQRMLMTVIDQAEAELERGLNELTASGIIVPADSSWGGLYSFGHALIRDAAYSTLLHRRRRQLHGVIADSLTQLDPTLEDTEPETLAHHHFESGDLKLAAAYWERAGVRAAGQSANVEADSHFRKALSSLAKTPRDQRPQGAELRNLLQHGPVVMSLRGWGDDEAGEVYMRAAALAADSGDIDSIFQAAWGLWIFHLTRSELSETRRLTSELLEHASLSEDAGIALQAHHAAWTSMFFTAELQPAMAHCESGIQIYDRSMHNAHTSRYGGHDPGVCAFAQAAMISWLSGWSERAEDFNGKALALAEQCPQRANVAHAHFLSLIYRFMEGRPGHVVRHADLLMDLGRELDIPFYVYIGQLWRGWALVRSGDVAQGLAQMDTFSVDADDFHAPFYYSIFGEASAIGGEVDRAIEFVKQGLSYVERSGERVWQSELYRLHGTFLWQRGDGDGALAQLSESVAIAEQLSAKALELRSATSLAQVLLSMRDRGKARDALRPVFSWFTEGFDSPDLMVARELLLALEAG